MIGITKIHPQTTQKESVESVDGFYTSTPRGRCKNVRTEELTFAANGFEVLDQIADGIFGNEHFPCPPNDAGWF